MPSIIFVLMLVVTLAGGKIEQTELAGPFTNLTACVIMGGILQQQEFTVSVPDDYEKVRMACVKQVRF